MTTWCGVFRRSGRWLALSGSLLRSVHPDSSLDMKNWTAIFVRLNLLRG